MFSTTGTSTAGATYFTTGTSAANTAGAKEICSTTGTSVGAGAMYSTTGTRAAYPAGVEEMYSTTGTGEGIVPYADVSRTSRSAL